MAVAEMIAGLHRRALPAAGQNAGLEAPPGAAPLDLIRFLA
jgi:hypothetical protein